MIDALRRVLLDLIVRLVVLNACRKFIQRELLEINPATRVIDIDPNQITCDTVIENYTLKYLPTFDARLL